MTDFYVSEVRRCAIKISPSFSNGMVGSWSGRGKEAGIVILMRVRLEHYTSVLICEYC